MPCRMHHGKVQVEGPMPHERGINVEVGRHYFTCCTQVYPNNPCTKANNEHQEKWDNERAWQEMWEVCLGR